MFGKILVPLDGSELSESVFPWLRFLGTSLQPPPEFLAVRAFEPPSSVYLLPELQIPTSHILSDEHLSGAIFEYLDRVRGLLNDLRVDTKMLIGEPAAEIMELSEDFDLVVMASHGRGGLGRWLLGSVATKVARGIQKPLMVVGAPVPEPPKRLRIANIVCPVDGSEVAERSLQVAGQLAAQLHSKLFLYRSVSQVELQDTLTLHTNHEGPALAGKELESLAARLPEGVEFECEVAETYGRTGIANYAERVEANLICMGSHGRGGFKRWMLGSETERVLQTAHCPVLVTH